MTWFLIVVLAVVVLLALLAVLVLAAFLSDDTESERARIEMEVRRAERRLHDVASNSFQAMLEEARTHGRGRVP
jgi:type II secretory pathway pseudopilin PulG